MVQFNTKDNEILVKIVFYGPGLSGKTTNLQMLHDMMDTGQRTDLFSVNTMEDRTLFFDLLPMDLGTVYGNSIKLQIYTVPGQVHYDSTRRIVLSGADGVVFIADSDAGKIQDNVQSINNLFHNLQANRLNAKEVPLVLQYNKRDLPNAMPVDMLNQKLNHRNVPAFEAVAVNGDGVLETFLATVKMTVRYIFEKYQLSKNMKNIDEVVAKLEKSLRSGAKQLPKQQGPGPQGGAELPKLPSQTRTVLKYTHNVNKDDKDSQDQLLQKALSSNMETARLYAELKKSQDALLKKNEEMKALYAKLEKSNADNLKIRRFLESLVNFAGEAIITFNEAWVIQNWNQAAEEMFGHVRDAVLGQNIKILFPDEAVTDLNRVISFVVGGKVVRGFETKLKSKTNEIIPVNITFSPIKSQGGGIVAFTALVRDLSFMSKMNLQLFALQRFESVGNLLPEWGRRLSEEAQDLQQQTRDTLEMMRLMSREPSNTSEPMDLNEVIESVHGLLEPRLQAMGLGWYTQLFSHMPKLILDRQQMTQALLNLALIAIASLKGKSGGKLTVGTHSGPDGVVLQMIDNGSGKTAEDLDRHNENGDDGVSLNQIRLNAARHFLKLNKGTLRVDSAAGKGTKVTVRFDG